MSPLYFNGFNRVGCVGCPLAGKHRYFEFAQYPKYQANYLRTFDKMLKIRHEKGIDADENGNRMRWGTTAEEVFHWWMEDGVLPGQIDMFEGMEDYDED